MFFYIIKKLIERLDKDIEDYQIANADLRWEAKTAMKHGFTKIASEAMADSHIVQGNIRFLSRVRNKLAGLIGEQKMMAVFLR